MSQGRRWQEEVVDEEEQSPRGPQYQCALPTGAAEPSVLLDSTVVITGYLGS